MRNNRLNLLLTLTVFITVCLLHFLFPDLEFKSPLHNRIFGILFNVFCVYLALIIYSSIKNIKNKALKYSLMSVNAIFLFICILKLPLYVLKIDPQIQYHDIKTLYWNKKNKAEKIEAQYYIDWKTNAKKKVANRVYDFGPFRNFIEYDVDLSKLDPNWVKMQ